MASSLNPNSLEGTSSTQLSNVFITHELPSLHYSLKWKRRLDPKRNNLHATCYPLCRRNTEGSKNVTFVCIQSTSVLSAQAEDPLELFRIRPVGDVRNSIHQHFRKLQQPHTQKHMKENTDRKNKIQSNFKLSHHSPCLQHLLIFH